MAKLQHQQVNIDTQLATVREIARQLRTSGAAPALVELFNWAHEKSMTSPPVEQLRDDLIELLRICGRIGRHCTQAIFHPDQAIEPFDRDAIAKHGAWVPVLVYKVAAMLATLLAAGLLDENPSHGLGRSSKEMAAMLSVLFGGLADEPQIRLVYQGSRL